MTQTRTETLPLLDGSELRLTVAEPEGPAEAGARGGIVVLHEARGVTDAVRSLVTGLAAEGWLVVAPHLYHRDGTDEVAADKEAADRVSRLSGESVLADSDAAFGWLAQRGVTADRMGVVGFDLGGSAALVVAASRSLGAAVTVSGGGITEPLSDGLPSLVDVGPGLTCPWLGLYGERTEGIPLEEVVKLRDAVAASEVASNLVTYPDADHRFDADPAVAEDAWSRTLSWFDSHLR